MTTSTIFINEPTIVDHSYIDRDGRIIGGSVNPSFHVSGTVTEDENVVLDFSKAKKQLKAVIDDNDNGFDHKCWILLGWSKTTSILRTDTKERVTADVLLTGAEPDMPLAVTTPHVHITGPKSAFRFMSVKPTATTKSDTIYEAARIEMENWLKSNMPEFEFRVLMHANPVPSTIEKHQLFRYVHGLKHSSSWGCQNIAHGHLSFVDVECGPTDPERVKQILTSIAKTLDNTIFISAENYTRDPAGNSHDIAYQSTSRGVFTMSIWNQAQQKFVVLETETTIEHIIEYVAAAFETQLKSINATHLYVSEGLSKGAVLKLEYN